MRRKRKEEYEIDPNSSFNKLRKLQQTLKEEVALTDIFFENRDELKRKIEINCFEYFKERIAIQEIYDNSTYKNGEKNKNIKYEVIKNPYDIFPQCSDVVGKLLLNFRNNNEFLLKLIEKSPKESYEILSNLLCNNFYVNIFSSTFLNESLLTLIYLLLEKEIDKLQDERKSFFNFLDSSNSFLAVLFKYLSRRDEVKNYLENVLKKFLMKTAGLLPNQKNKMFLGMDLNKIKNELTNKYDLSKTKKTYMKDFNILLRMDIKKTLLDIPFINNNKSKSQLNNQKEEDIELTDEEIENNFYVQATKETFDDLLFGTEDNDFDVIQQLIDLEEENDQKKKIDFSGTTNNKRKREGKDDFENYLIKSGFYYKSANKEMTQEEKAIEEEENKKRIKEEEIINKNKNRIYSDLYNKELNRETLLDLQEKQVDDDMEEYLMNKVNDIQNEGMDFTYDKLINNFKSLSTTVTNTEKVILIYKYHFELIKQFIDELLMSLINNLENTPYMIRAICTIISKLLEIKFPKVTNIQKISFISEFLFTNLIYPILNHTSFNGIMIYNFLEKREISNLRNTKIILVTKILKKLLRGEFYNGNKQNEICFIPFNSYFIEIMPHILNFFRNISSTKLPLNIEKLLEYRKSEMTNELKNKKRNIDFSFLEVHPDERMEYESICISLHDFFTIYDIIKPKNNFEYIFGNIDCIQRKMLNKISYQESKLRKKLEDEINKSKRVYSFFTQLNADKELHEKLEEKRDKNLSFQSKQELSNASNENFILSRVKY